MAQITYRANLSAATFPFLSSLQGRTVIVPQQDQNFIPQVASAADADKDRGIPQIYYCHNVMPTGQGFQSVRYQLLAAAGTGLALSNIYPIYEAGGVSGFLSYDPTSGKIYSYQKVAGLYAWRNILTVAAGKIATFAKVNGVFYFFISTVGCYTYNGITDTLTAQTLSGLSIPSILGITSAFGYMIAWSALAVAWSSTIDPTDFVPSLATGAGGGNVEQARGPIILCAPIGLGFIIYTSLNAVSAAYTNNARFPFNFKELTSAGGITGQELVGYGEEGVSSFAYTTHGMQSVTVNSVTPVFPELVDFLTCKILEDYNFTTKLPYNINFTSVLLKRIILISARYLVISYGINTYTHALVYDISLKRWGKLRQTHVAIFECPPGNFRNNGEIPRSSIGLLQSDGTVYVVDFRLYNEEVFSAASDAVLILGKFQLSRNRLTQLQQVDVESLQALGSYVTYDIPSIDGKAFDTPIIGYTAEDTQSLDVRYFNNTAINHSLMFTGDYNIVSVVITFNQHGKR